MLKPFGGALLVLLVAAVAGCASTTENTPSAMSATPANAAGSWSGYAGMGAAAAPVSLNLTQTGANVTGNLEVAGSPDLTGPVVGTVQGNTLTLSMQNGRRLSAMNVSPDQINGIIPMGPVTLRRTK